MRTPRWLLAPVTFLAAFSHSVPAQSSSKDEADAAALRDFADGGRRAGQDIKWDPHFRALMQQSLHQRQSFWRDHGHFESVPELIATFIGVPGSVTLAQDRYLTVDGCVPHACSARGMVWIDLAAAKPSVIFVAENQINQSRDEKGSPQHLWLFSSTTLDWQHMPQPFIDSFDKWFAAYHATSARYFEIYPAIVTIVQPTGENVDLTPALVGLSEKSKLTGGGTPQ
jgi:hypothetical protein